MNVIYKPGDVVFAEHVVKYVGNDGIPVFLDNSGISFTVSKIVFYFPKEEPPIEEGELVVLIDEDCKIEYTVVAIDCGKAWLKIRDEDFGCIFNVSRLKRVDP